MGFVGQEWRTVFVENNYGHCGLDTSNYAIYVQEWKRADKTNMVAKTNSETELAELSRRTACVVM